MQRFVAVGGHAIDLGILVESLDACRKNFALELAINFLDFDQENVRFLARQHDVDNPIAGKRRFGSLRATGADRGEADGHRECQQTWMAAMHDDSPEAKRDARRPVAVAGVREGLIHSSSNY